MNMELFEALLVVFSCSFSYSIAYLLGYKRGYGRGYTIGNGHGKIEAWDEANQKLQSTLNQVKKDNE